MQFGANEVLTRQQLKNTIGEAHEKITCYCVNKPRNKFIILWE